MKLSVLVCVAGGLCLAFGVNGTKPKGSQPRRPRSRRFNPFLAKQEPASGSQPRRRQSSSSGTSSEAGHSSRIVPSLGAQAVAAPADRKFYRVRIRVDTRDSDVDDVENDWILERGSACGFWQGHWICDSKENLEADPDFPKRVDKTPDDLHIYTFGGAYDDGYVRRHDIISVLSLAPISREDARQFLRDLISSTEPLGIEERRFRKHPSEIQGLILPLQAQKKDLKKGSYMFSQGSKLLSFRFTPGGACEISSDEIGPHQHLFICSETDRSPVPTGMKEVHLEVNNQLATVGGQGQMKVFTNDPTFGGEWIFRNLERSSPYD